MKRKAIWLLVAASTFFIGIAATATWFYFPRASRRQDSKLSVATESFRGSERMHACIKSFDINLGDSFQHVKSLIDITPNVNGPNQNGLWVEGKPMDFMSLSQPLVVIDKDNALFSAIFCTFDAQKRLKSFQISWTLNGENSHSAKRKMIDIFLAGELTCIRRENFDLNKKTSLVKTDYGDYVQEFEYDFSDGLYYSTVSYSITMKECSAGILFNSLCESRVERSRLAVS